MNLEEIVQYTHKIKKFEINNQNTTSDYKYALIKINIPTNDSEVIRFSTEEKDDFIKHQKIENDYYCYVPNILNDKIILYAHFFPAELYTYDEMPTSLVSEYDFNNAFINITKSTHYTHYLDEEGHLIVTGNCDPNYKQYVQTEPIANKTEQGKFPLSSKYRSKQNWIVPSLNDTTPKWQETNSENPYWEAKINFNDNEQEMPKITTPVNVFINYEYLPSSREYHQHYYGFEPTTFNEQKIINVFEGTNINQLDAKFGSQNNYRLINLNNPYDDSYSIYVPHEDIIPPIDLSIGVKEQNCTWMQHQCDKYYIYVPQQNDQTSYCSKKIQLNAGHWYSLHYYIYIPSKATVTDDSCYIGIDVDDELYKMDNKFITKDKVLRDQWVYHEVPFIAGKSNVIKIIGPQGTLKENRYDDSIFFIDVELHEMVEYSPTVKYTSKGVRILEQNQTVLKDATSNNNNINPDNKIWTPTNKTLPDPYSNIDIDISTENLTAVYGPNNIFEFNISNTNDKTVNGKVEVSIVKQKNDLTGFNITKEPMNVQKHMIFKNIDLTDLPPNTLSDEQNKYYLKIKYIHACLIEPVILFKTLYVEKEESYIPKVKINNTLLNIYDDHDFEDYNINMINQFPLKIEVQVVDQNGAEKNIGYCELSIDDCLHQSTLLDNGWGDFYLRQDDLKNGRQTIKIEYYRQYNKSLAFIYFDIVVHDIIDEKDFVQIDIHIFENGITKAIPSNGIYEVDPDECVLSVINTHKHSKFRFEVYRDDVLFIEPKNVYNANNDDTVFIHANFDEWQEVNQYTFKIKTGNMLDQHGNVIQDLYRDYERTFVIKKKNSS